jgi:hypothetical protein
MNANGLKACLIDQAHPEHGYEAPEYKAAAASLDRSVREKAMAIRPERAHHCFMAEDTQFRLPPPDAGRRS